MNKKILIGSRGSELALWQANFVFRELAKCGVESEIRVIKTQGDKIQNLSLDKLEGKGFFTKEIEDSLLAKETDLAVHSHKDLPTTYPDGLVIGAVSYREDPSELLIIRRDAADKSLKLEFKHHAVIGTSSARRKSQLLALRNDIVIKDIRGNVPTRIQKLRNKEFDAILLAAAGVFRLEIDLSEFHVIKLDPKEFVPAPSQGVLALQMREGDDSVGNILKKLNHADVAESIAVERKILNLFDGGCHLPLGAYCIKEDNLFKVWVSKSDSWNQLPVRVYMESETADGLAEKVVSKIKNIKPTSVFISRNAQDCAYFKDTLLAKGYQVEAQSLVEITPLKFNNSEVTTWIFFSSKNGVKYYFEQNPVINPGTKFAAIGPGTAAQLIKFVDEISFVGKGNDTRQIAVEFSKISGNESILFPGAKNGLKTIQNHLTNQNKIVNIAVYEVVEKNIRETVTSDIVVLTSPSNAKNYLRHFNNNDDKKIIAIGKSTAKALKEAGLNNILISKTFSETGLLESVFGC